MNVLIMLILEALRPNAMVKQIPRLQGDVLKAQEFCKMPHSNAAPWNSRVLD